MSADSPLLQNKHYQSAAIFNPANLLRETRRQKALPPGEVPRVCVLDPDGDIVAYLLREKLAERNPYWACYHTVLYQFELHGIVCGISSRQPDSKSCSASSTANGPPTAQPMVSITSAGQILPVRKPPYFVLIEKALRDEGTSHHYLAPERYAHLDRDLGMMLTTALEKFAPPVERGAAWTTDAPYRETPEAIAHSQAEGILAVEMEAASLYAFARAKQKPVVCFAHITNRMGVDEGDFEKGEADGSVESLRLIEAVASSWTSRPVLREEPSEVQPVQSRETSESERIHS